MTSTNLPGMIDGWPVRWEARGKADNGRDVIGGMTAVVDAARIRRRPRLRIKLGALVVGIYTVTRAELDGQPVGSLGSIALDMARDLLTAEILP